MKQLYKLQNKFVLCYAPALSFNHQDVWEKTFREGHLEKDLSEDSCLLKLIKGQK